MFLHFFSRKHEKEYVEAIIFKVSLEVELINYWGQNHLYVSNAQTKFTKVLKRN